jgi:hypothetical protein
MGERGHAVEAARLHLTPEQRSRALIMIAELWGPSLSSMCTVE